VASDGEEVDGDDDSAESELRKLLRSDMSTLDDQELIAGIRSVEEDRDVTLVISGRMLAELHRRGHSWPQISRMTGVSQTTCWRRAEMYL
jgi:hypothetical protein